MENSFNLNEKQVKAAQILEIIKDHKDRSNKDLKLAMDFIQEDFKVTKESLLKHEQPSGEFSNEHQTLKIEKGNWVMGKQVEFNPFNREISRVWD